MASNQSFLQKNKKVILIIALIVLAVIIVPKIIRGLEQQRENKAAYEKAYNDLRPSEAKVLTQEEMAAKAYNDLKAPDKTGPMTEEEMWAKAYNDLKAKNDN